MTLNINDLVTVKRWINSEEYTYVGDLFRVHHIESKGVTLTRPESYGGDPVVLDLEEVELLKVENDYTGLAGETFNV